MLVRILYINICKYTYVECGCMYVCIYLSDDNIISMCHISYIMYRNEHTLHSHSILLLHLLSWRIHIHKISYILLIILHQT